MRDEDTCEDCDELIEDCICWDEDGYDGEICVDCGEYGKEFLECGCYPNICDRDDNTDEFDDENVADTFRPMNAFVRARWLKAQEKS